MISIIKATEADYESIVKIGKVSVCEAHEGSGPTEDLAEYMQRNYCDTAIKKELCDENNVYHIICFDGKAVGFSKIILNAKHSNVPSENAAKLDRIYLLKEFHGLKLGYKLLSYVITYCKSQHQSAIWLYTWVGNSVAIAFYQKVGFKVIGSHEFYLTTTTCNLNHQMLLDI